MLLAIVGASRAREGLEPGPSIHKFGDEFILLSKHVEKIARLKIAC
jgi:hypothetical protein